MSKKSICAAEQLSLDILELDDNVQACDGLRAIKKAFEISGVKNVEITFLHRDNFKIVAISGIASLKYGQKYAIKIHFAMPFVISIDFSLLSCSNEAQRSALEFVKNKFKKQFLVDNRKFILKEMQFFEKHLILTNKFFEDMHNFLVVKMNKCSGKKIMIVKHELSYIVPPELRIFPKNGYCWSEGRGKSFFQRSRGH